MSTPKQIEANGQNAQRSTGPKSAAGKARSSQNALQHGLRSNVPVLPGERPEDWEAHRAGIFRSLVPVGALEEDLAGRVALCLWRLRRAAAYETVVTAVGLDEVEEDVRSRVPVGFGMPEHKQLEESLKALEARRQTVEMWEGTHQLLESLPDLTDDATVSGDDVYGVLEDLIEELPGDHLPEIDDKPFLAGLGVPRDELEEPFSWKGWTAGIARRAIDQLAVKFKLDPDKLRARVAKVRRKTQDEGRAEIRRLEREAKKLRRRIRVQEDRLRLRRTLPAGDTLDRITRYEAHLSRQMLQALHTLERIQLARGGEPVPPPAALDVTINQPGGLPQALDRL
jgi:hypothetical protein